MELDAGTKPCIDGNSWIRSVTLVIPDFAMSSEVMVVTGRGASPLIFEISEPVISILSIGCAGAVGAWAKACAEMDSAAAPAKTIANARGAGIGLDIFSPPTLVTRTRPGRGCPHVAPG